MSVCLRLGPLLPWTPELLVIRVTRPHTIPAKPSLSEQGGRNQLLCRSSAADSSQLNWRARVSHGSGCTPDWKRSAPCKPTPVLAARVASAPVAPATIAVDIADSSMELWPGRAVPERSYRPVLPDSERMNQRVSP